MHCNVAEKWMVAPGWSNCWHERCDKCVSFYHANDFTCISFAIHNIPIYGPSTCRPTRANQHAERPTYPAIHQERENVSAATRYHCVGTQGRINHRQSHQLLFSPSFSPKKTFSSGKSKKVLALDNSCQLWKEDDQSSLLIGKVDWASSQCIYLRYKKWSLSHENMPPHENMPATVVLKKCLQLVLAQEIFPDIYLAHCCVRCLWNLCKKMPWWIFKGFSNLPRVCCLFYLAFLKDMYALHCIGGRGQMSDSANEPALNVERGEAFHSCTSALRIAVKIWSCAIKLKIAWGALEVWTLSGLTIGLGLSSSSSSSSSCLSWLYLGQ